MDKVTKKPTLVGRYWLMPDGDYVPDIRGGSDGDGAGSGDAGTGDAGTGDAGTGAAGTGAGTAPGDEDAAGEALRLRKDLKTTRSEAASYRRKLRELEDKIDGVDVDKYQAMLDRESDLEKKKLEDKGEYDKLLEEHKRRSDAQLQKAQETGTGWKQRYEKQVIDNVLLSAATNRAVNAAEAVTLIRANYKFGVTEAGDVEITDAAGTALFDKDGNPVSTQNVMAEFLDARAYLCKPNGGGSGSRTPNSPARKPDPNGPELHGSARIAAALRERLKQA